MDAHARTWTSQSRKLLVSWGPSPQSSQAPFMEMAISALQTGWTLMDRVSSVSDCKAFPSPILLWFKIFPLQFYISSPARYIFSASLTWVRVCPKAASPPPVSSSPSFLTVNKNSLCLKQQLLKSLKSTHFLSSPCFDALIILLLDQ